MIYAGDESTSWNDAGPCPDCGDRNCWLDCRPGHLPDNDHDERGDGGGDR